jgi:catabolite regulation protein CreA
MHMKKILMAGVLLVAATFSQGICEEQSEQCAMKTVHGTIIDIDWVGSQIVVRTVDNATVDEITFYVTRATVITKGTDTLGLADLIVSETVTVDYCLQSFVGLEAARITVDE